MIVLDTLSNGSIKQPSMHLIGTKDETSNENLPPCSDFVEWTTTPYSVRDFE